MRILLMALVAGGIGLHAPVVFAQHVAAAEALFEEGRALMAKGKTEQACSKLAESQRLDPSPGTALNLASCHQRLGLVASAWAEYLVAKRLAQGQGRERIVKEAQAQARALEPRLSYVKINAGAAPQGVVINVGETRLEGAALDTKIPMDPGKHILELSAPGYEGMRREVEVGEAGSIVQIILPNLTPLREPAEPVAEPQAVPNHRVQPDPPQGAGLVDAHATAMPAAPDHTWAYILGGIGFAGLGAGAVLGVLAQSKNDEAKDLCDGNTTNCPAGTADKANEAQRLSTAGWIAGGAGLASVGVAAVMYFTSETPQAGGARIVPRARTGWTPLLREDRLGVLLQGTF
jgi:hypothetical protein